MTQSNRPYILSNNLVPYDSAVQLWQQRIDQVREAGEQWLRAGELTPASSLGIPAPAVGN